MVYILDRMVYTFCEDCGIFIFLSLTMITGKNCVLLNSVQEITEIEAWLLLIFFICLRNKLSSIHSTAT